MTYDNITKKTIVDSFNKIEELLNIKLSCNSDPYKVPTYWHDDYGSTYLVYVTKSGHVRIDFSNGTGLIRKFVQLKINKGSKDSLIEKRIRKIKDELES